MAVSGVMKLALFRGIISRRASSHLSSKSALKSSSSLLSRNVSVTQPQLKKEEVEVTFVKANGERIKAKGKEGDSLLDIVVNNEIDLDGYGACEGTLTCSTCHLILKKEDYDRLPGKPTDEEMDMLDLAYDLTDTSRLGCQIIMNKSLDGLEVTVPSTVNDARSN
ncbi:adrenodoxin-like protein 2, mitochondrial [Hetaerina americana]|uniref:adrenodoxin-like protein 2, mitochondrial n=1 Tax=Hetaerina americana TaxID=62018 RepID=UPI003A7F148B